MKIEIKIDDSCLEPKVIVVTDKVTEEISMLVKKLSDDAPDVIAGFHENEAFLLEQTDIIRIFALNGNIFTETQKREYKLKFRLYELEKRLDKKKFVRISNSEIINLREVKGFDLSFTGTICVTLSNGAVTYVSRRFVSKIKQVLGI